MQVLMVRHAPAQDRKEFASTGQPDELRPLTDQGKTKMYRNALGIQTLLPKIHTIVNSPLRRAQQTADILAQVYPQVHRDTLPSLAPLEILAYLKNHADTKHTIVLVGHEPDLGELITWLLSGHTHTWLLLKKGAACLLEFPNNTVTAGTAQLNWALTPSQLRKLGESG